MPTPTPVHELSLTRIIDAPPAKLWRAWTEPDLLKSWFCPAPWRVSEADLDLRPGGRNRIIMNGPDGEVVANEGVYLEIVPERKLVFTDAYSEGWVPAEKPFMTGVITFEDLGDGRTRYVAKALHWNAEDRKIHEDMGFEEGWGICADQLASLAAKL